MAVALNYITPQGLEALKKEYNFLKKEERPKTVTAVSYAAALGDRSENADYIYGKRRLREIDRRLRFLQRRIETAEVVDPKTLDSETIVFGATVTIEDEDGEEKTYRIVGEDETDAKKVWISWKSPVAKSLLGKREGDEVLLKKPAGDQWCEIVKVEYV